MGGLRVWGVYSPYFPLFAFKGLRQQFNNPMQGLDKHPTSRQVPIDWRGIQPTHWVDQGLWDALPMLDCDTSWPGCQPLETISCGTVLDMRNDDPGSTSTHAFWGCGDFATYTGPELSWSVVTDRNEPVTVRVSNLSSDLDLFAIRDFECDGRNCAVASTNSATSDEELTFDATSGVPVAVAIDGWEGATSSFRLEVLCNGGPPTPGTGTGTGTGSWGTNPPGTGTGTGLGGGDTGVAEEFDLSKLGCGCRQGPSTGDVWMIAAMFMGQRRR